MQSACGRLWRYFFLHGVCLVILIHLTISGCAILPIPTAEHDLLHGRQAIEEADRSFLKIGTTSREDIILRFGEPDVTVCNERVISYTWQVAWGYMFFAFGGIGEIKPMARDKFLMFEFDERGYLKRFEELSISNWTVRIGVEDYQAIEKWIPPDCPKPSYR